MAGAGYYSDSDAAQLQAESIYPMNMEILSVVVAAFAAVLASAVTWIVAGRKLPVSHRVAIIGFPRTGKTSLITALFEYYFRRGARGVAIAPRGEETIERINDNIARLQTRREILPTTDQDVFAYRADVLSARRYKLEIGDFPGEDTIKFAEQYGGWLHSTPYFKWAVSADAFIFVIDFGVLLKPSPEEEVARHERAFRAAWQRLREQHLDGTADLSAKSVTLVFTKVDLLARQLYSDHVGDVEVLIHQHVLDRANAIAHRYFSNLIEYFSSESIRFDIVYTCVFTGLKGERQGVPELAMKILPKKPFLF
jgi:GTPase SAR1 family protein